MVETEMEKESPNILLGKLSRLHLRRSYTRFMTIGVTQGQPRILRYLKFHKGCIQRELSDNCFLEPATVTNILAKMEYGGLVKRRFPPGNRRSLQVFLTRKGEECFSRVEKMSLLLEDECFKGFTPAEKEQAICFIERICNNMEKAEEISRDDSL